MLTIHLDTNNKTPLYEQIYQYIRSEICNGSYPCNKKLPSTRKLAAHLQISRNTVDLAYSQLLSEGYIESQPKRGYYVCPSTDLIHVSKISTRQKAKPIVLKKQYDYDFSPFAIDISSFPFATWRRLSRECMSFDNNELFLLGDRQGDLTFRESIARYLHESRSLNISPDQIIIGAGADYLLQLLSQILPAKTTIAMENPTYLRAYQIFKDHEMNIAPIPLTSNGIDLDLLAQSGANICYVTPSHQYPVGIVMPYKQRLKLLRWVNQDDCRYVIEDDHDSEFRYRGKPIPALAGMDHQEKVIYLGTFSRAIAPAIRIGYMVLPEKLLNQYHSRFSYYASTVSRVDQAILTSFISGGYFERHLNRMRKIYKSKHDTLLASLKQFGSKVTVHTEYAGLHLLVDFHFEKTEQEIFQLAESQGIRLYPLSEHYIEPARCTSPPKFLIGFGNLKESEIQEGIHKLYNILTESMDEKPAIPVPSNIP